MTTEGIIVWLASRTGSDATGFASGDVIVLEPCFDASVPRIPGKAA
ncbi:MAG: hypothetical protein JXQ71_11760 [Verrucomicrobia bacterium]|nr:hypothetical protein [Verrucomicrobiota bacterium]